MRMDYKLVTAEATLDQYTKFKVLLMYSVGVISLASVVVGLIFASYWKELYQGYIDNCESAGLGDLVSCFGCDDWDYNT